MTISIIVPVYNASLYLRKCIDSILFQSFKSYELILVNDGSTDDSLEILLEYKKKNSSIKLVDGKNEGVSAARNKGLDMAVGDWITFVDADDYLLPDALEILYNRTIHTGVDLVLANAMKLKKDQISLIRILPDVILPHTITSIKHFALWGYLFRGDIIKKNNLRFIEGLAYSEDRLFVYQMACHCQNIAYCNEPVYVYRINPTSACASRDTVKKACHHFVAGYYVKMLAQTYIDLNKETYRILSKDSKALVNLGIYSFIEYPIPKSSFKTVEKKYEDLFGQTLKNKVVFYFQVLKSYFVYIRRRIISIIRKK